MDKSALLAKTYPDQSEQSFGYYLTEMRIHSGINPPLKSGKRVSMNIGSWNL